MSNLSNTVTLIVLVLMLVSCNQKQASIVQNTMQTTTAFQYKVEGCAAEKISKSLEEEQGNTFPELPESLTVTAMGDSIVFHHQVNHFCCRKVNLIQVQNESTITITENWHGMVCKCHCNSNLQATITPLAKGTYKVFVLDKSTDLLNDSIQLPMDTIWRGSITIR